MRAQSAFIIWTAIVLHSSVIKGQTMDSSPDVRSPLNEVTPKDRMTSESDILESRASTAYQSVSSPSTNLSTDEVRPTVPSPSQSSRDAVVHNDTSPSSAISQTPELQDVTTLNMDTASVPGSSASSPSISFLKSTVSDSVATTAPATSISPSEGPQTVSSSASSVIQTTQTAPPFTTTCPQASQIALTSSSKVTGPAPLEDQDESSELDVGDQESGKVPHRPTSPLDPLLAALVTVFIICTAMVSAVLFLRFRQRSEHPEFHRLQDLPMHDLLEDTPLSRYTY
ncbi:putative GPI-anchored protein PB15E9.01c [Sinocyclocheilus anshuiensis]|uniref:putative GPI-anchored protein PB15E9.01c n=1 Tax=Sinocyclocheilus anshuiensis TaxID=1608454 RepID=UPI0007B84AB5|nr:PREDICTED: putative GPI-anchored protein PB15E9.01c [Sinocyclocheilus anshuiensis]